MFHEALAKQCIEAFANTARRKEDGQPGTALQHFARALQVFGALDKFRPAGLRTTATALRTSTLPTTLYATTFLVAEAWA